MNWTDYFDEIFLINLPSRPDRLAAASKELQKCNIPFTAMPAIAMGNGAMGLTRTMQELFKTNKLKQRILVFEDDVKFVQDPNIYMPLCVEQLQRLHRWDMFYLGINTDNENNLFSEFAAPNLLPVKFGYSTHAVAYSQETMRRLLSVYGSFDYHYFTPTDILIAKAIQEQGHCYCSYPLLATQADGYSDIEQKHSTYDYIESRFAHSVAHLLK